MRPTPIPDDIELQDGIRKVQCRPPGSTVPTDALLSRSMHDGHPVPALSIRLGLDKGDLEKLTNGGSVWLTFLGNMPVFSISVEEE